MRQVPAYRATRISCDLRVVCESLQQVCAVVVSRRSLTRLYTSFYRGNLFPNQLVRRTPHLPGNVKVRDAVHNIWPLPSSSSLLSSSSSARIKSEQQQQQQEEEHHTGQRVADNDVSWDGVSSTDLMHINTLQERTINAANPEVERALTQSNSSSRPYVPLGEVAKLELQGDYLSEGNLHQNALEYYGVVMKCYELAYPANHNQRVGITLKLAGAFRRTGRLRASQNNIERALKMLDNSASPSLELLVEALFELGLTHEAQAERCATWKDNSNNVNWKNAGAAYEEAVSVVERFHNMGESHRMLRLLPRLGRRFHLNFEQKFLYYSPFDYDRTFALVDQCLNRAEALYRRVGDQESLIRVLQTHKEILDKKFFNMRDFAGRIHTMRGHSHRRAREVTNAPTPDELLRFSPTIHQVYRNFRYELNAPIGREGEVMQGVNRVAMDLGNPQRRMNFFKRKDWIADSHKNYTQYIQNLQFD